MSGGNNEPSKVSGNIDSTLGSAKQAVGDLAGAAGIDASGIKQAGNEQRAAGNAQYDAATAKELGEGLADQARGSVNKAAGAVTGDENVKQTGVDQKISGQFKEQMNK